MFIAVTYDYNSGEISKVSFKHGECDVDEILKVSPDGIEVEVVDRGNNYYIIKEKGEPLQDRKMSDDEEFDEFACGWSDNHIDSRKAFLVVDNATELSVTCYYKDEISLEF
jgi:hypothetical protein